jgi:mono/diheme cytochrome c family protein
MRAAFISGVTAFVVAVIGATHASPVLAQTGKTVWDGVFSEEQAARGRELYNTTCAPCHKEDLSGQPGPNLAAEAFYLRFDQDHLGRIYNSILTRMPADNRGTLRPEQAADLVAHLLSFNKFPAGAQPLPADMAALTAIRVMRKDGPTEAPNLSLVHIVGCLTKSGTSFVIANATTPMVTKNPEPSKDAELTAAQARALGSETFGLVLLQVQPTAVAPHAGSKVEAKGLLIRGPQNRINLTSIQPVAATCN